MRLNLIHLKIIHLIKIEHLVELNYAVYHSFKKKAYQLSIILTAAKQFELFERNESTTRSSSYRKMVLLAPPLSPTLTSNYHHGYDNTVKDPNFFYKSKNQMLTSALSIIKLVEV